MPARRQAEFPIHSDAGALQRQLEFPICEQMYIIEDFPNTEVLDDHRSASAEAASPRRARDCQRGGGGQVGMDAKTARKYRRLGKLPSEVKSMDRNWRTRPDPFAEVWPELEAKLQVNPGLEAKTLFADLQRRFPGRFARRAIADLAAADQEWRALERAGQGGVLRPGASSRPAGCQRLHALHASWA